MMQKLSVLMFIVLLLASSLYADLSDATITVVSNNAQVDETVEAVVSTTELLSDWNVISYEFLLIYDASILEYVGYSLVGTLSENGMVSVNDSEAGQLHIGFITSLPLAGIGDLLTLQFEAKNEGISPLNPSSFSYNNTAINNLICDEVVIEEVQSTYMLSIHSGWNLIGVPFTCAVNDDRIQVVWKYDQMWTTPDYLDVNFGYWIKASEAFELELVPQ